MPKETEVELNSHKLWGISPEMSFIELRFVLAALLPPPTWAGWALESKDKARHNTAELAKGVHCMHAALPAIGGME